MVAGWNRDLTKTSSSVLSADIFIGSSRVTLPTFLTLLIFICCGYVAVGEDLLDERHKPKLGLYPSMVNLAATAKINANATCGDQGPEHFCKLVEHVHRLLRRRRRRSQCDVCDASSPHERHDIQFAIDGKGNKWWQSPSINNGYEYHWVTITLDLKQVFQIAYFIMKSANSPRPGNWILEKSIDGETWEPWQYFAQSERECRKLYPARVTRLGTPRLRYDSEVVCTPYFSELLPLQNGEIHISLVKGRPTAENPSDELVRFTSARYVRLRFQRIRTLLADLMTIAKNPANLVDPTVTKRYFYSIKDISIGGMCICHGHAHDCPSNPLDGKFVCKCEHNTMGANCENCLPMFNQHRWQAGNAGFQCEECNCHGHASSCYYDENVERRKESLNTRGVRIGGGVCIGCRDFTAGVNCDSCIDGYYRPAEVHPTDSSPCRACICNGIGTRTTADGNTMCRKSLGDGSISMGMHPGDCYCKDGYTGRKCDKCQFGYRGFPDCKPCPCNVSGSLNADPCVGECICKKNVVGEHCDQCKVGFYNLDSNLDVGCSDCYCSGKSSLCKSAKLFRESVKALQGWEISDRYGARKIQPLYDETLGEPYVDHENASRAVCTGVYYWSAPEQFLGNKLSSYGGQLSYTVYYELPLIDAESELFRGIDVILEGEDMVLELSSQRDVQPRTSTPFTATLKENSGWLEANSQLPASKDQILDVMSNLKRMLIRASYNRNGNAIFRIRDVGMDIAKPDGAGEPVSSVELCRCPIGYFGLSCEDCAPGYFREGKTCVRCRCNGHSPTCDLQTGVCENCQNGTTGANCETCLPGYFGDAIKGECQRCACPLTLSSNNFSPTCTYDELDDVITCNNCPKGYSGYQCEKCSLGYYGEPTIPGERCRKCECNGNSLTCDTTTGMCVGCYGNTTGSHCEKCALGYYGDAIFKKNCSQCSCDPEGSLYRYCHPVTGQCSCRPGVSGRRCDTCPTNQYLDRKLRTCVPCHCDTEGSYGSQCGTDGQCACKYGVGGKKCDNCKSGYYNFGIAGCSRCNCPSTNNNCNPNTGDCVCPTLTAGYGCTQCMPDSYGWDAQLGCKACNCHEVGSKSSQCGLLNGNCQCKDEYGGRKCDSCREGFFDFPNCIPCVCNVPGTVLSTCSMDDDACGCNAIGECHCKENVVGMKCTRCMENTFSLQADNPKGCTECFCFGVTDECKQADYHWGSKVSLTYSSRVAVANRLNTRSTTTGVLMSKSTRTVSMDPSTVKRSLRYEPYYWRLPPQFNGDKSLSYGGKLTFNIYFVAALDTSPHAGAPTVVLRGVHNRTAIAYRLSEPKNRRSTTFSLTMRESGWTYLDTDTPVSRADFAMVLHGIEYFLIKASYGNVIHQSRLSNVYLDAAVEGSGGGRGDSSSSSSLNGPRAYGIEDCACPPGYTGLSCQECDVGFTRIQTGVYLGECRPCACNGKSDICDVDTGSCLNCRDNFFGHRCDQCKPGYYLVSGPSGPACSKCACPLPSPENSFSATCKATTSGEYICDSCPKGYEGPHCERCSLGYYGNPSTPGGFCGKCGCNPAGSVSQVCDRVTGQCTCIPGVTGKICDECHPRHAITEDGCLKCGDECSGRLIDDVENMTASAKAVKLENMFPPPWGRLLRLGNKTTKLEIALDRAMTTMIDETTLVRDAKANAKPLDNTVDTYVGESQGCYLEGDDISYKHNKTQKMLLEKIKIFEDALKESGNLAAKMERLLNRMEDGAEIDGEDIVTGITSVISELRGRDLSPLATMVNRELRLAEELSSRVSRDFINATNYALNHYNNTRHAVKNTSNEVEEKLNDLNEKMAASKLKLKEITKLNDLNRITLKQLSAEAERLRNEIVMAVRGKDAAKAIVNNTDNSIERCRNIIAQIQEQAKMLKQTVEDLQRESDKIAAAQVRLKSLGQHVQRAQSKTRQLFSDSIYMQEVAAGITELSLNAIKAATRFTQIFDVIRSANDTAHGALQTISKSMLQNLDGSEYNSLIDEMRQKRNVLDDKKRQIKLLLNQAKTRNSSLVALRKGHEKLSESIDTLDLSMPTNDIDKVKAISSKANAISKKVMAGVSELEMDVNSLERDVNIATKRDEIVERVTKNLKSVPERLRNIAEKVNETNQKKINIERKSAAVRSKIMELRRQIEESRMKAGSIRGAAVKSEGECVMRYEPRIQPGRITEIVLQVMPETRDNTLFYMGKNQGDFILVYTVNGLVHVSWDLGSGRGSVVNPVNVVKNETLEDDWYQIELVRKDQEMKVVVFRKSNKSGTMQSVSARSPGESTILNADETYHLYVGGVPDHLKLPHDGAVHSFTGCIGESLLQRKPIGLWNFREISSLDHCNGCAPPPNEDGPRKMIYGFNGKSYSLIQYNTRRHAMTRITAVDLEFKTASPEGVLFYMGSSISNDFIELEFADGYIVILIDLGTGIHKRQTVKKYNNGKWWKMTFRRLDGRVKMLLKHSALEMEVVDFTLNGTDNHLNTTSNDLLCFGGCPSERTLEGPMQKTHFIGCISNVKLWNIPQLLMASGNVLRFSGVETTCPKRVSRDIGIDVGGFVEIPGHSLRVADSVSITFNSREPDALLLLATDGIATRRRRRRRNSSTNFYSLALSNGHIEARLRAVSGDPLILRSELNVYSDGEEHTALLRRKADLIQLIVDDDVQGIVSGNLVKGGKLQLATSRIFVGGIPNSVQVKDMASSNASLNGCVRELITNRLVDFQNVTNVAKSYVGSCAYTPTVPFLRTRPKASSLAVSNEANTTISTDHSSPPTTISPTPTTSSYSTTPNSTPTDTTGCAAEGQLRTLKATNVRFGQDANSHLQFAFDDDISTRFRLQIEFRTLASHGLLLYAASDEATDFFSLQLKNGIPVFLFDSGKGPGEAMGNSTVNDGQWHTIRLSRSKRKGYLKVDNMRYENIKSPKGANRMDVVKRLYVGGVPANLNTRRLKGMWQSLDSCVRSVTLNKVKLNLRNPKRSQNISLCYESIEEGGYFDGTGYAIYDNDYRVGPTMNIELEFRTWARDGVFVSISDKNRSDGLALELVNGTVVFRVNNGGGDIVAQYAPSVGGVGTALCDGKWHRIKATKQRQLLTLTVDGQYRSNPQASLDGQKSADTYDPLYIGGCPGGASPQKQLSTMAKFKGCIRRMKLKGQTVDFSRVFRYQNIYPNACPRSNGS